MSRFAFLLAIPILGGIALLASVVSNAPELPQPSADPAPATPLTAEASVPPVSDTVAYVPPPPSPGGDFFAPHYTGAWPGDPKPPSAVQAPAVSVPVASDPATAAPKVVGHHPAYVVPETCYPAHVVATHTVAAYTSKAGKFHPAHTVQSHTVAAYCRPAYTVPAS